MAGLLPHWAGHTEVNVAYLCPRSPRRAREQADTGRQHPLCWNRASTGP